MKLYFMINKYCGGTQVAIQALHSAVALLRKYDSTEDAKQKLVHEWADTEQTVVFLNGGSHDELHNLQQMCKETDLPFCGFREPGMNESWSSIAILCNDDEVYDMYALRKGWISMDEMYDKYPDSASVLEIIAYGRKM